VVAVSDLPDASAELTSDETASGWCGVPSLVEEIRALGLDVDVTNGASVDAGIAAVVSELGLLDIRTPRKEVFPPWLGRSLARTAWDADAAAFRAAFDARSCALGRAPARCAGIAAKHAVPALRPAWREAEEPHRTLSRHIRFFPVAERRGGNDMLQGVVFRHVVGIIRAHEDVIGTILPDEIFKLVR
jgi:hypothetical protein